MFAGIFVLPKASNLSISLKKNGLNRDPFDLDLTGLAK
jgi:hypothetical protein